MNTPITLSFNEISAKDLLHVGGKGANLGEMTQANFPVPPGFCITTTAFKQFMATFPQADDLYTTLENLAPDDVEAVRQVGQQIREQLSQVPIPTHLKQAIITDWQAQGPEHTYAVRSSATAEDLPTASFAGQQDTYLNVQGQAELLDKVRACWVSLFTDRAILYRAKNGFSHRDVQLSTVVQRMILPQVSGILFTADPVTGHRQIVSIDASFGLGEALVSGLVSPDLYKVDKRTNTIIETQIADKKLAIRPQKGGGTFQEKLGDDLRTAKVLTDKQIKTLAQLGSRIEAHYNKPQDIEWCIEDEQFYIVQARPITSLFPLPKPQPTDNTLHLYISLSHAQVMTDPMTPMGISMWRIMLPFGKEDNLMGYNPYLKSAAGRMYTDLSSLLHHPLGKRILPKIFTIVDPLSAKMLQQLVNRIDFQTQGNTHKQAVTSKKLASLLIPLLIKAQLRLWWHTPEGSVDELNQFITKTVNQVKNKLNTAKSSVDKPDVERLKISHQIFSQIFISFFKKLLPYITAAMISRVLLKLVVGKDVDPNDMAAIDRGFSGNVTTEMDLEVGDLADIARQSPELIQHLTAQNPTQALKTIRDVPGGDAFMLAWDKFMQKYGMRGPSEIDIGRLRWQEAPAPLLQVVIANLQHKQSGSHRQHHQQMAEEAKIATQRLIAAVTKKPLGFIRVALVKRFVRVIRNIMAIREHPKYLIIQIMGLIKQVILETAQTMQAEGRIDNVNDIWQFELLELLTILQNPTADLRPFITKRKADMARFKEMTPPRIITSDGEIPVIKYAANDFPTGALPGSPVSAGVIEGIAKVVTDPNTELLSPGEILIAPFTDPGWTPLFINAAALVMEVGGLMTHGSVVAREYGIPAVVGVLECTQLIKTGQRIRVDGNQGYVEILNGDNN